MALSAVLFCLVAFFLVLFHSLLLFGAPLGHLTQGGFSKGKLPKAKRFAALLQILILLFMVSVVLTKAQLTLAGFYELSHRLIWVVVTISALSLILNLITPSKKERLMGVPITSLMVVTSLFLALG